VKRIPTGVRKKAARIELLLLDVDGVLTDGGIIIDDRGVEAKRFDVRDGQGITLLLGAGIKVGFMTARSSKLVANRAKELGVSMLYQAVRNKVATYELIKRKTRLHDEQIAYMGDDWGDIPLLHRVGLALTVRDGWSGLRTCVHYVARAGGGHGAVREICDLLLTARGKMDTGKAASVLK
jgi:3-deoxy-D-manno-octulosonate 8-phosphate phosphatase (KDO 8-P phosphatase)